MRQQTTRVSVLLRKNAGPLWQAATEHPFIDEMGTGTLPLGKFRRYFVQDYIFVRDLVKVAALAVAKAPDMDRARRIGGFLTVLLGSEDALFLRSFHSLRISEPEWRNALPHPVTSAFGDFLVRTAYGGSFLDICTALLATEGAYLEWGTRLERAGARPRVKAYREWIAIHSEEALGPTVRFLEAVVDGAAPDEVSRLQTIFDQACRFEALFWDMAYRECP